MGKTKTALISGLPEERKTGKESYEEKKQKKLAEEKKKQVTGVGLKGGERIKIVGGDVLPEESEQKASGPEGALAQREAKPKVRGKKYKAARAKIDRSKHYPLKEAVKLVKETSYSAFNGTVELHLVIKKDKFSANVTLPHSAGKEKKIEVASDETLDKLKKGKIDFDVLLATPAMMPKLVPFAKLLGPRGLMPNPKNQTLIKDAKDAKKFSGNTVVVKTEKAAPVIHTVVGKVDQKDEELIENTQEIIEKVDKKFITKAYLASTIGPSVKFTI